ncbi:MFS transporter [Streptomyces sp. NPDC051976]|uniref:MFS transporter n=1 Tax=Streptomyces sp. NPDC051976 TaxID=3154947 RepID=UPI00343A45DC
MTIPEHVSEQPPGSTAPADPAAAGATAEPDDPAARRHALRVLALGSLGVFVVFLDTTIVNVAFETISHSFHTTTGNLAWVLNAYSLVFAAMLIPAGRLADRYGRKRVFLIGIGGFAVMSALCGAAPNAGVLIAGRALQAVFAALTVPTSLALLLPEFPPARRHVAVGTWGAMGAAAAALGPTLGAVLTQYASWRWIFLLNVPICALIIAFGVRLLRESRDPHAEGLPDPAGVLLVAAMPALLSLAIIEGPSWGWSDPRVVAAFALSAALLPVFLWRSAAAAHPVMDLALFKVRQFRLVNAATLVFSSAFYGMLLSNIIFLQTEWHYSVLRAALASTPGPVVVTLVNRRPSRAARGSGGVGRRRRRLRGAHHQHPALGHPLAARVRADRPRYRPDAPGPVRRRRGGPAARPARRRLRHQLQLPATRRGPRHQPLRRRPRQPHRGHRPARLPPRLVGLRRPRPRRRSRAADAPAAAYRGHPGRGVQLMDPSRGLGGLGAPRRPPLVLRRRGVAARLLRVRLLGQLPQGAGGG